MSEIEVIVGRLKDSHVTKNNLRVDLDCLEYFWLSRSLIIFKDNSEAFREEFYS